MAYNLPNGMEIAVAISYVDKSGNPATVDGAIAWDTSDASIAAVSTQASDGTSAIVLSMGTLGQAQISATADADLGEGVRNIITLFDVSVVAGEAVSGTITPVGDPVTIPVSRGAGRA